MLGKRAAASIPYGADPDAQEPGLPARSGVEPRLLSGTQGPSGSVVGHEARSVALRGILVGQGEFLCALVTSVARQPGRSTLVSDPRCLIARSPARD